MCADNPSRESTEKVLLENSDQLKVVRKGALQELEKKGKKFYYFVLIEQESQLHLIKYSNELKFKKSPKCYLFILSLSDALSIFNYELEKDKPKCKKSGAQSPTTTEAASKPDEEHLVFLISIFTQSNSLTLQFKSEETRLEWHSAMLNETFAKRSLNLALKMFNVHIKIELKCHKYDEFPVLKETTFCSTKTLTSKKKAKTRFEEDDNGVEVKLNESYRLCFHENETEFFSLVKKGESVEYSDEREMGFSAIKFNLKQIKRIGHDKLNQFVIELGQRSVFGKSLFFLKCESYRLARFLHNEAFRFMSKYKESTCEFQKTSNLRKNFNGTLTASGCTNKTGGYYRSSSYVDDKRTYEPDGTQIEGKASVNLKRCCTFVDRIGGVFRRLSSSSAGHHASTPKNSVSEVCQVKSVEEEVFEEVAPGEGNESGFKRSRNLIKRSMTIDYVESDCNRLTELINGDGGKKSEDCEVNLQPRCNTDGYLFANKTKQSLLANPFNLLEKFKELKLNRLTIESGYETSSVRTSSFGSKENEVFVAEISQKKSHLKLKNLKASESNDDCKESNDDDGKNSKVFDTYSFMEFGETAQKKHEEPVIKEDFVIREEDEPVNVNDKVVKDSPVEELGDIPPPFLL